MVGAIVGAAMVYPPRAHPARLADGGPSSGCAGRAGRPAGRSATGQIGEWFCVLQAAEIGCVCPRTRCADRPETCTSAGWDQLRLLAGPMPPAPQHRTDVARVDARARCDRRPAGRRRPGRSRRWRRQHPSAGCRPRAPIARTCDQRHHAATAEAADQQASRADDQPPAPAAITSTDGQRRRRSRPPTSQVHRAAAPNTAQRGGRSDQPPSSTISTARCGARSGHRVRGSRTAGHRRVARSQLSTGLVHIGDESHGVVRCRRGVRQMRGCRRVTGQCRHDRQRHRMVISRPAIISAKPIAKFQLPRFDDERDVRAPQVVDDQPEQPEHHQAEHDADVDRRRRRGDVCAGGGGGGRVRLGRRAGGVASRPSCGPSTWARRSSTLNPAGLTTARPRCSRARHGPCRRRVSRSGAARPHGPNH